MTSIGVSEIDSGGIADAGAEDGLDNVVTGLGVLSVDSGGIADAGVDDGLVVGSAEELLTGSADTSSTGMGAGISSSE